MRVDILLISVSLCVISTVTGFAQAIEVEPHRLIYRVSTVQPSGDAADQARRAVRGSRAVKLRAFVVGRENVAPVRVAIEAEFKRRPMPLLNIVVVGALPGANLKVSIESVSESEKIVNPHGIAYVSGQPATSDDPAIAPLIEKSLAALDIAHRSIGVGKSDVLIATCFVSNLVGYENSRRLVGNAFPRAAINFVQLQREYERGFVECETVVRQTTRPGGALILSNPAGLPSSPNYSHIASIGAKKVVLTEVKSAAGEVDAREAFRQMDELLKSHRTSLSNTAMSHIYPVSQAGSDLVRGIRFDYYDRSRPPGSTLVIFEGLPAPAASFAFEVVAVIPD